MAVTFFSKPGARERATVENIVERKISVSPSRLEELETLQARVLLRSADSPLSDATNAEKVFNLAIVHITPPQEDSCSGNRTSGTSGDPFPDDGVALLEQAMAEEGDTLAVISLFDEVRSEEGFAVGLSELREDGWKEFKDKLGPKAEFKPDAVVLVLSGDLGFSDMAKTVAAAAMLQSLPLVAYLLPRCTVSVEDEVLAYMGRTWPAFRDYQALAKYVSCELLSVLRLREALRADVCGRVEEYKQINAYLHFTKRAAVALIPFAVAAVNFAGLVRLCGRMMSSTGMVDDRESQKAAASVSTVAAGKILALDTLGDVYQFAICATVLADFATAASLELALQSLSLADVFLLGTVSVVTGVISACGAYYTRPELVDTIAGFIANMQLIYLINPDMRRSKKDPESEAANNLRMTSESEFLLGSSVAS